jgi:hypothetical protein
MDFKQGFRAFLFLFCLILTGLVTQREVAFASSEAEERVLIDEFGLLPVTSQHKKFVAYAQTLMGVNEEILVLKNQHQFDAQVGSAPSGKTYIGLCGTNDVEYNSFIVYHELAHLFHNDTLMKNQVSTGEKLSSYFLELPDFKADLDAIERYKELGKTAFDTTSLIGKRIHKVLQEYDNFWIAPEDEETYTDMLFLRGTESRADLLACKKLLEQKNIDPLLRIIDLYSKQTGYWGIQAIGDTYPHPSAFERALYIAGFLVDHGIDINEAFKKWNAEGECSSYFEL